MAGRHAPISLRLLCTSDVHLHLTDYDYFRDDTSHQANLAQISSLISEHRRDHRNVLVVDNGDFLQGTPLSEGWSATSGQTHPAIAAMNTIGYDAATLGNHEFNFGLPYLKAAIENAGFPIVLSNIVRKRGETIAEDEAYLPPYAILEREVTDKAGETQSIKIGIVGFAPPQILVWDKSHLKGELEARGITAAARHYAPILRSECDVLIALCHSGFADFEDSEALENALRPMQECGLFDALVGGHTHLRYPNEFADSDTTPTVLPGANATDLGVIDLTITAEGTTGSSHLIPVSASTITPDKRVIEAVDALHEKTLRVIRQPICTLAEDLTSYSSLVGPNPVLKLVAEAQFAAAQDYIADDIAAGVPVVSVVSPFRVGGRSGPTNFIHQRKGALNLSTIFALYPYPNTITALKLTVGDLRTWLEQSASVFSQIVTGSVGTELLNDDHPSYNFDVVYGAQASFDLTRPARFAPNGTIQNSLAMRVKNLTINGFELSENTPVIALTNSYRSDGGGNVAAIKNAASRRRLPITNRDAIISFLQSGAQGVFPEKSWQFLSMPQTCAVFENNPLAEEFLPASARIVGFGSSGFARYEMCLDANVQKGDQSAALCCSRN